MGSFLPSPGGGSFLVSISWQKPNFNYSSLSWYRISYKVGSRDDILANTVSFLTLSDLIKFNSVTPVRQTYPTYHLTPELSIKEVSMPANQKFKSPSAVSFLFCFHCVSRGFAVSPPSGLNARKEKKETARIPGLIPVIPSDRHFTIDFIIIPVY